MDRYEKYIERSDLKGATHLEVSVYYAKGGPSPLTDSVTPRGYYLSVRPVTKRDGMVSANLFSGRRQLLFETSRYTAKQFVKAIEKSWDIEDELIALVATENQAA